MYEFYYDCFKPLFDKNPQNAPEPPMQNCRVCYTDTDSLIIKTKLNEGEDIYRDYILPSSKWFDLSAYSKTHRIFEGMTDPEIKNKINENKKVIGKFKDEMGDYFIKHFVGIRAKCYTIKKADSINVDEPYWFFNDPELIKSKCKGVCSTIPFQEYYDALKFNEVISVDQVKIRSDKHALQVKKITNKRGFDAYDDKRMIEDLYDVETLPYGHKRAKNKEYEEEQAYFRTY